MSIGILGKKVGMTRVYDDAGSAIAVTVIEAEPNSVTQIKSTEKDGYEAVQLAYDQTNEKRTTSPMNGHFKKAGTAPFKKLREFPLFEGVELEAGAQLDVSQFEEGQFVDVIGLSKGRGFQGGVHRHGFAGQPDSHGSKMHRRTGSVGAGSTPGRVWKNTKMPGHMGDRRVTVQNLKIVQVRTDDHCLLVKGAIPGAKGSYVVVRDAVKKEKPKMKAAEDKS
ncbi:MAG: 50S ribosomal protein L3 [Verrucomicrobiota bacterium]